MKIKTCIYLTTMLVTLSGCALWTDFDKPATETPAAWKTGAAHNAPAWPDTDWWKQFQSPELDAQIAQAQAKNFDIKAAIARIRQADAQVRIAGAALLPAIGATAEADRTRTASNGGSANGVSGRTNIRNTVNAELSASYEIDFWGKNWATAEAARELAEASRYDWEVVNLTSLSSVATNYFAIIATQDRLAIARDDSKNAQELLDAIDLKFKEGTATALDVAQQQSVVATQRATVPPLELQLQQDMDAQGILLGTLPEALPWPQAKMEDIAIPAVGAGLPSELLERRPDVKEAEADLASAHANIIVARAQFFPSISLTGDGGYASTTLAHLFDPASRLFSIGANLAQPIFEGGALEGNLQLSKARYDELLEDYRKSALSAYSDVEDALSGVQKTAAEEEAQKAAVDTARNAYALSEKQLNGGIVDITSVLNTQRSLFSAEDAYAQARLVHLQAVVGLYKALGGGWKNGEAANQIAPQAAPGTPIPDEAPVTPEPALLPPLVPSTTPVDESK